MSLVSSTDEAENVIKSAKRALVLFNGDIESSHLLHIATKYDCEITALIVDLGQSNFARLSEIASCFPVKLEIIDSQFPFVEKAISTAIQANAALSARSALVKTVVAKTAFEYANEHGYEVILHASSGTGNSNIQLNTSLSLLGYSGSFGSPYQSEDIFVDTKQADLLMRGLNVNKDYPVPGNSNLWYGHNQITSFKATDDYLAKETLFSWYSAKNNQYSETFSLTFTHGVPTHLNGKTMHLIEIIDQVNKHVGAFGIGLFSGSENVYLNKKVLDLFEAPAALAITKAFNLLETKLLDEATLSKKRLDEKAWLREVENGHWYGLIKGAKEGSIKAVARTLDGTVNITLKNGLIETHYARTEELLMH